MIKLGLGTSCSVSGNPPSSSILDLENMFSHPELISLKNCPISTQQTHNWMTLRHGKMNKTNRKIPTFCGSSFIKIHQARYLPFPIIDPPTFTPFWISAEAKAKWALGIQMVDGNNEGWVVKIVIWMMCAVYIYIYMIIYTYMCIHLFVYHIQKVTDNDPEHHHSSKYHDEILQSVILSNQMISWRVGGTKPIYSNSWYTPED